MKTKTADRMYVWGFAGVLAVMSLLFVLLPKQAFSETENRRLQKVPQLAWERIWSKKFAEDAESYVSDHFPFRPEWVAAKSGLERLRLQKENNGIYLGKNGYLLEKFAEPDYEQLGSFVDAVNQFAANRPNAGVSFLLAPNSVGLYPELLPWLASAYPQSVVNEWIGERLADGIAYLNGFDFLRSAADRQDKPLYYRTDHHWTTYGAYLAYQAYAEDMGWRPLPENQFHIRAVSDDFLGSYHTRSQFGGLRPDRIVAYEPTTPVDSEMQIADTGKTAGSLYDPAFLNKKDKYAYFQGGVHALVKVTSQSADADLDKLLIVKDSYAHSVLPFLTNHVREIHMIDIRFYNGNIGDYMEENGIQDALLLFNTSTFVGERGLLKLKY